MPIPDLVYRSFKASLLLLACGLLSLTVAQTNTPSRGGQEKKARPAVLLPDEKAPASVARRAETYCGGYIQSESVQGSMQVVGGEQEQERHHYGQGDYVYLDGGAQQGVRAGQEFAIFRPRGRFSSKWSKKKGKLGVYVQELGQLRVVSVKDHVSVAIITESCEAVQFGDLLKPVAQRVVPTQRVEAAPLDRFSEPSGKQGGRIVLARDNREALSKDFVVYIDLGTEDNIKAGDYFTVYRPVGAGNLTHNSDEELSVNARDGFESRKYQGGKFSNKATRVKDPNGDIKGPTIKTPEIKRGRPALPRKVVGELVVLNVQSRTATAVITRVAQEIHTGDFVELQ
ncbi:MAG TPA: hypothetical protein VGO91_13415 [Pyrinomonadaceae bacterium]|nr:hypothetical protein [Pyrinomonadaceae bacterium]